MNEHIKKQVEEFVEEYNLGNGFRVNAPETVIHKIAKDKGINAVFLADFYHMYLYLGNVMGTKKVYDTKGKSRTFDNEYYGRIILPGKNPSSRFGWNVGDVLNEFGEYNLVSEGVPKWIEDVKQELPGSCGLYCLAVARELSKEVLQQG